MPHYQKGSILITAMVFMLLLTIAGVTAMRLVQIETQAVGSNLERNYAYQAAESGLIRAEEIVHQRMANFGQIIFLRQSQAVPASCDAGTTICFIENTCRNGLCMRGFFDAGVRDRMTNSEPFSFGAHSVFPIAMTPSEIVAGVEDGALVPDDFTTGNNKEEENAIRWLEESLEDFQDARPWSDKGTETNQWTNASSLSVSIPVPDPDDINAYKTENYDVEYLIEFRGFNLAEGADPVAAMLPNNLPPSNFWMMTYRVTVKVDANGGNDLDGTRVMLQGLYTRQLPRAVDAAFSVNRQLDNPSSDIAVYYGDYCTLADFNANNVPDPCVLPSSMGSIDYGSTTFSSANPLVSQGGKTSEPTNVNPARQRPPVSDDQYFGQYFDGNTRAEVLNNAAYPRVAVADIPASGCDYSDEDVVIIEGDLEVRSHPYSGAGAAQNFLGCTFGETTKVIVTGRAELYGTFGYPGTESIPPMGLLYVMGEDVSNPDDSANELEDPSWIYGSTILSSLVAFQNDLRVDSSVRVAPRTNPFAASSFSSLDGRSRYAWRELAFDN
ncbi:pilus assembly PilX family protein [Salinibius halmophilus]|uniref:pilus assembly PilX family protein n=1 Tax=Salinibius halmophilus TaxID=1853216 RepID=UPI000E66F36F|nr:pilus assembly protein [Salinibius halmophilus]